MALAHYRVMPDELADALVNYFQAKSFGTRGANLFLMDLPSSPAPPQSTAILPRPGMAGAPTDMLSRVSLQVLVRDIDIRTCTARAKTIWKELDRNMPALVNSLGAVFRGRFLADHLPGLYYFDQNGYPVYSLNFTFQGLTTVA